MVQASGLKALIVEDEAGVALLLEDMLTELGCEVVASIARLERACEAAAAVDCDFAILDVNIGGSPVFPVAEILEARAIPFVFSTGYGAAGVAEPFQNRPILSKPFPIEHLKDAIGRALSVCGK